MSRVASWARQQAERARQAMIAAKRAITQKAKRAVAWAAKHNPLPALKAALRPVFTGLKKVVSAAAHLPATVVAVARDVVHDTVKAAQVVYQKAVEAAGVVVESVSTAVQAVSEFAQEHAAAIAGFAAGALVGVGCGLAIGWTGVGAVACGALAGMAGSLVHDLVEGGHGWKEMTANALVGGLLGGVTGGFASIAGQAIGASLRGLSGGIRAAGQEAIAAGRAEAASIASGRLSGGLLSRGGAGVAEVAPGRTAACALGGNSFAAGTPVLMADGSHKRIEDVKVGDKVVATDPTTGRTQARPVTDVIVGHGDKKLVEITVDPDGPKGRAGSKLTATDGHPFWVADLRRWVDAKDLKPGNLLRTSAGTYVQVSAVRKFAQVRTVYNLTIDTVHTYYVSVGSHDVLSHNECYALFDESGTRFLKWGYTADRTTRLRFYERELGYRPTMIEVFRGESGRVERQVERWLYYRWPGPLNREPKTGSVSPREAFNDMPDVARNWFNDMPDETRNMFWDIVEQLKYRSFDE